MKLHQRSYSAQDDQHRGVEREHPARPRDNAARDVDRMSRGTSNCCKGLLGILTGSSSEGARGEIAPAFTWRLRVQIDNLAIASSWAGYARVGMIWYALAHPLAMLRTTA